jgi:GNAT superfamily N-acetyltransferase
MRETFKDIVHDPDFYNNEWPDIDISAWVCMEESLSENRFRSAYLVQTDDYDDKEFVISGMTLQENDIIGKIMWYEPEGSDIYYIAGLFISDDYQNCGVGYFLGGSIRSFFAVQGIKFQAPPPLPDQRQNPYIENIISKWCIKYQDDIDEFLAEDGNYYVYSEWYEKFNK